jgi:transposase
MARKVVTPTLTKSDRVRTLLAEGKSIADSAREVGIGYAFAYGIAQRAGLAQTAAKRRPEANSKMIDLVQAVQPRWTREKAAKAVKAFLETKPA